VSIVAVLYNKALLNHHLRNYTPLLSTSIFLRKGTHNDRKTLRTGMIEFPIASLQNDSRVAKMWQLISARRKFEMATRTPQIMCAWYDDEASDKITLIMKLLTYILTQIRPAQPQSMEQVSGLSL
jgi:hypothetical protein